VDTVTNQSGWYSNPTRSFAVDSPGCYSQYRLDVTADNYNDLSYPITLVSIATLQLYGLLTSASRRRDELGPEIGAAWGVLIKTRS
jgi:hypothetical protein